MVIFHHKLMSVFDQIGEQSETAMGNALGYNRIGWFAETTAMTTDGVETSTDKHGSAH
jgi:hypothetical protein